MAERAPHRRRAAIETYMSGRAEVDIPSLATRFGVSEMTIRRDLEALEGDGVVRRLMGGRAVMAHPKGREPGLSTRADDAQGTKAHIGQAVADLIADDEVVFFDGGSTALAVARALRGRGSSITVLTRSLLVAAELATESEVQIFLLGGRVKASEMMTTATSMADDLASYNVDTYVMGISGVDARRGLTDYDPEESAGKRLALQRADRVILAFDRSKIGRVLMSQVAGLDAVDVVVTDAPDDETTRRLFPTDTTVVLVDPSPALERSA